MAPPDTLCVRCRYALKGVPQDARCPECGLAVADSLARPGLTNAPIVVLTRLKKWSFVLAVAVGALFILSTALFFTILQSITFFFGPPSPLATTLLYVLPSAMLVAVVVAAVAAARATTQLHEARCCSSRARSLVTVGSALLAGGWGLTLVEQFTRIDIFNEWFIAASVWIGGAVVSVCWSQVQRMAARSLGGGPRRAFAMLQLVVACALASAGGVIVLGVFLGLPYLPGGYTIYSLSQNSLPYLIFALLLLTSINALVLSLTTRRLLKVRLAAGA